MKLEHIGIAVKSIKERLKIWHDLLGLKLIALEDVPDQKVKVAVLENNGIHIELLESTSDDGVIAKFIKKKGEGIHHLCFRVDDVAKTLSRLKNQGIKLIDEVPRTGANNKRMAFVHPKDMGGVLIELSQE
jgi:methylmalonyl-CoA/ethylmalonyl-CoA epimerase